MALLLDRVESPIGELLVVHDAAGTLRALDFHDYEKRMHRLLRLQYGAVALVRAAAPACIAGPLRDYFDGHLSALAPVAVATGGTEFQRLVWDALRRIPPGERTSYGALAVRIGRPRAVRAVGHANGANPIAIVVPCHRLVGADGGLTGFGGGLHRKRWLLEHESGNVGPAILAGSMRL